MSTYLRLALVAASAAAAVTAPTASAACVERTAETVVYEWRNGPLGTMIVRVPTGIDPDPIDCVRSAQTTVIEVVPVET